MDTPNPKRPCQVPSVSSSVKNPSSIPIAPGLNQSSVDMTLFFFLILFAFVLLTTLNLAALFDLVFDKVIPSVAGTSGDDIDQHRFLDRTLQLATLQNSISWPLLPELTSKVFSMLNTNSLMQASVCCTMFNKCAMDPVCYTHIDLTKSAKNVDDGLVCILINRAGKELRSLKLGPPSRYRSLLSRSCLAPLSFNNGYAGGLLRCLHLHYLIFMNKESLNVVFEICPKLTDLKIVGFVPGDNLHPLEQLAAFTRSCRLLEKLFLENFYPTRLDTNNTIVEPADDCPNLTSLTFIRFGLNDSIAVTIIMSFRHLKYINLSFSPEITGFFLRDLRHSCKDSPLETLLLCNCYSLTENEVSLFLYFLLGGDFMPLRCFDVSSEWGLLTDTGDRTLEPKFPIVEALKKQRSAFTFVAIFQSSSSRRGGGGRLRKQVARGGRGRGRGRGRGGMIHP